MRKVKCVQRTCDVDYCCLRYPFYLHHESENSIGLSDCDHYIKINGVFIVSLGSCYNDRIKASCRLVWAEEE